VNFHIGLAHEALEASRVAAQCFQKAAEQQDTGRRPQTRFYQAMSMLKLGRNREAHVVLDKLIQSGRDRLRGGSSADFFAKFGEQKTRRSQTAAAHYLIGLGLVGKEQRADAQKEFEKTVNLNASHTWARYHLMAIKRDPVP
jgi:tetratricopeptide (TPR) repeat protein